MKTRLCFGLFVSSLFNFFMSSGQRLPDILPTSPEASSFQKYGDYPVNLSSGIPEISIPLYEIKTSRFNLPISISYHARGFKAGDQNGNSGLGWTFNAGYRISRTVQGDPDELTSYPAVFQTAAEIDLMNFDDRVYLVSQDYNQAYGGAKDADYDIFYYNLPTGRGKFFLKNLGLGRIAPVTSPSRPIKIVPSSEFRGVNNIDFFEITDESGNLYRYTLFDTSVPDHHNPDLDYRSSWHITEMISCDRYDTIKFKYQTEFRSSVIRSDRFVVIDEVVAISSSDCAQGCNLDCKPDATGSMGYNSFINYSYPHHTINELSEITYKNGSVKIEYGSGWGSTKFIDKLIVRNSNGQVIKEYDFSLSRYSGSIDYYKLDQISLKDSQAKTIGSYNFQYNEDGAYRVPGNGIHTGIDRWGFYNGRESLNQTLIPNWQINTSTGQQLTAGTADREANENAVKTFSLTKIKYPTGGETEFIYEANRIPDGNPPGYRLIGGLRIKQIRSSAGESGQTVVKTYVYGENESGFGKPQVDPYQLDNFLQTGKDIKMCNNCNGVDPARGGCGAGQEVPIRASIGRARMINSDFVDGSGLFETSPIFYTHVTEYVGDWVSNIGKTLYVFDEPVNAYQNLPYRHLAVAMDWKRGNLLRKHTYKNTGGAYIEVENETNTYTNRDVESLQGFRVYGNLYGKSTSEHNYPEGLFFYTGVGSSDAYRFNDYTITTGISQLTSQTITKEQTGMQTTKTWVYNTFNNQPITASETGSQAETLLTKYWYPGDYDNIENIPSLLSKNIVVVPIKKEFYRNGVLIDGQVMRPNAFGNPFELYKFESGTAPLHSRTQIVPTTGYGKKMEITYDATTQQTALTKLTDNISTAYLWGYNNTYPVAKIEGASPADAAGTSFDSDGKGNWVYAGLKHSDINVKTGTHYYKLSGGNITKSLSPGTYKLEFWAKTPVTIVGGTITQIRTSTPDADGWILNEFQINVASTVTLTLSGSSFIDELRLYPMHASMTTYTYNPSFGMTSTTDTNNVTTYYGYDNFGRLRYVKDDKGNILKTHEYHYRN
jgi:hypothetical protein